MTSTLYSNSHSHPSSFAQRNFGFQFEQIIEELNDIESEEYEEEDVDCYFELQGGSSFGGNNQDRQMEAFASQQLTGQASFLGNMSNPNMISTSQHQFEYNPELLTSATWKCSTSELQRILCDEEAVNVNFQDPRTYTALHYATSMGNSEITTTLLEYGSRVNVQDKDGRTPLMFALAEGNFDVVKSLIEHGADLNIQNNNGETALHLAAIYGNDKIARLLLKHGAAVNQYTLEGVTPLHFAAASGYLEVVRTLIERGAHLNSTDEEGDTPLHWAVRESKENILPMLLAHGANVDIPNEDNETPLHLAVCLEEQNMVNILRPYSKLDQNSFDMEL